MKLISLVLCLALSATSFAEVWHSARMEKITAKCLEQHPLPMQIETNGEYDNLSKNPSVQGFALCVAKSADVYSEEDGFNVDRLTMEIFRRTSIPDGAKRAVQDCIDNHKGIASKGEMIVEVVFCSENESKKYRRL